MPPLRRVKRKRGTESLGDQRKGLLENHNHIAGWDSHLLCLTDIHTCAFILKISAEQKASRADTDAAKTTQSDSITGSNYKPAAWFCVSFMGFDRSH